MKLFLKDIGWIDIQEDSRNFDLFIEGDSQYFRTIEVCVDHKDFMYTRLILINRDYIIQANYS